MSEPLVRKNSSAFDVDNSVSHCRLLYVSETQLPEVERLQDLAREHNLSLSLTVEPISIKLNQKNREQLSAESALPILLLDDKNKLSWLSNSLSVAPEWDKLQRRVVSAGRKTELLLQATKITADSHIIDATAGFGHDSLILASTGAQVTMLEQQPLMALLLLAEQQRMSTQPNWQKLMARLQIINTDALSYFGQLQNMTALDTTKPDAKNNVTSNNKMAINKQAIDVVYLDPMFPDDSYQDSKTGKGAKVGKHMQALHHLARPPTSTEEQQLLKSAQALVGNKSSENKQQGRVIVKRPQYAPLFANQKSDDRWQNGAVRFDGYFS